jgi:hypothetical protein
MTEAELLSISDLPEGFASPGWEQRDEFPDFNSWLRQAIEDLIEFGA